MPKVKFEKLKVNMTFKEIRLARGISISYVAERLGITYVSMWAKENGDQPVYFHEAKKLALIYNYNLAEIRDVYKKAKSGSVKKMQEKIKRCKKKDGRIKTSCA